LRPLRAALQQEDIVMISRIGIAAAVAASVFALGLTLGSALAQDKMSKDTKTTTMSKDKMSNDKMSKGAMSKDGMKHDGMTKKDEMKK
jgi:pentapeptide MXKDX repeat protein